MHVARGFGSTTPMVVLATAHPAKFPEAVEAASGRRPALPARLGDVMERKEVFTVLPSDQKILEDHVAGASHGAATVSRE
jgi:threonine synthase